MSFFNYLLKHKFECLFILVFNILCHGSMLLSNSVGIDTEALLFDAQSLYKSWMNTGRAGLVLLKLLTGTYNFNHYFAGIGTLLFLSASCILWTYLFYRITGKEGRLQINVIKLMFLKKIPHIIFIIARCLFLIKLFLYIALLRKMW